MEFPSLDPNNNYIYIKFATLQSNALLMYTHDNQTGDKAEFLALEILEARLRFSFNLGSGTYRLMTMMKVSDGQFHTVIARRAGMVRKASRENSPPVWRFNGPSTDAPSSPASVPWLGISFRYPRPVTGTRGFCGSSQPSAETFAGSWRNR